MSAFNTLRISYLFSTPINQQLQKPCHHHLSTLSSFQRLSCVSQRHQSHSDLCVSYVSPFSSLLHDLFRIFREMTSLIVVNHADKRYLQNFCRLDLLYYSHSLQQSPTFALGTTFINSIGRRRPIHRHLFQP